MKKSYLCTRKLEIIWLRGVAQSGSAPGLGPGGRRFESCRPDVNKAYIISDICLICFMYNVSKRSRLKILFRILISSVELIFFVIC